MLNVRARNDLANDLRGGSADAFDPAAAITLGGIVSSSYRIARLIVAGSLTLAPMAIAVGQSSVAISPFVSYIPSATQNPLAGIALTFGGTTGLALRGSADISVANPDKTNSTAGAPIASTGGFRPWAADADAVLFLGGIGGGATVFSRSLSPYVFSGIGLTGGDSAGTNVVRNGWSYGAGAAIPLGLDADLFGEARWRMSQYVLPTSKGAPDSKSELRFGLSFHVGGGSRQPAADPYPRRGRGGHRMDDYEDVAVVAPVPAPATATATAVNVNVPESVAYPVERRQESDDYPIYRRPERREAEVSSASSTRVLTTARTTARSRNGIVYRSRVTSSQKARVTSSSRSASSRSAQAKTSTSSRRVVRGSRRPYAVKQ